MAPLLLSTSSQSLEQSDTGRIECIVSLEQSDTGRIECIVSQFIQKPPEEKETKEDGLVHELTTVLVL